MNKKRFTFDPRRPQRSNLSKQDMKDSFIVQLGTTVATDTEYAQMIKRMHRTFRDN